MTDPDSDFEAEYRTRAVLGIVRFMIHDLGLLLPWRLSPAVELLIRSPKTDLELVVASKGDPVAVLSRSLATELVKLSTSDMTSQGRVDVSQRLFEAVMHMFYVRFAPRLWSVRRPDIGDPAFVLIGAERDDDPHVVTVAADEREAALCFQNEAVARFFVLDATRRSQKTRPAGGS